MSMGAGLAGFFVCGAVVAAIASLFLDAGTSLPRWFGDAGLFLVGSLDGLYLAWWSMEPS
jgi:hypothetical protein